MVPRLSERVFLLLKASVTDLLDFGGDSSATHQQGELLSELKHELGRLIAHRHSIVKLRASSDEALTELDNKAAIAVERDREDLARAALEHKSVLKSERDDRQATIDFLDLQIDKISKVIKTLEHDEPSAKTLKAKLNELDALVAKFDATKGENS